MEENHRPDPDTVGLVRKSGIWFTCLSSSRKTMNDSLEEPVWCFMHAAPAFGRLKQKD